MSDDIEEAYENMMKKEAFLAGYMHKDKGDKTPMIHFYITDIDYDGNEIKNCYLKAVQLSTGNEIDVGIWFTVKNLVKMLNAGYVIYTKHPNNKCPSAEVIVYHDDEHITTEKDKVTCNNLLSLPRKTRT